MLAAAVGVSGAQELGVPDQCLPQGYVERPFLLGDLCWVWAFGPCLPLGTGCCLSLPGGSGIGLTSGNHFSFFGKYFSRYTHIPCSWWVWRRGKFPKKGKEISQMQAEVKWAQGGLTGKWGPEQLGQASGFSAVNGGKHLETQTATSCLYFCSPPLPQ